MGVQSLRGLLGSAQNLREPNGTPDEAGRRGLRRNYFVPDGIADEVGLRSQTDFFHEPAAMTFNRSRAEKHHFRNAAIAVSFGNHSQHQPLAIRQSVAIVERTSGHIAQRGA